jgi:hypothetical protein
MKNKNEIDNKAILRKKDKEKFGILADCLDLHLRRISLNNDNR